jgi:hypothetical protein
MPLPTSYLIFRASSQAAGKCWLDALELGLSCSSLLVRSSSGRDSGHQVAEHSWEYEQHFTDQGKISFWTHACNTSYNFIKFSNFN